MTNEQIDLVKRSFERVEPIPEQAAVLFYTKLFELSPSLRPLFKNDIRAQGDKLLQMLDLLVKGLDNLDELIPVVRNLGARHAAYGVKNAHYETVAEALLWMLETVLGADFTIPTEEAWVTLYGLLAETMKDAACQLGTENAAVV